jgi:hypothetical protein
VAPKASLDSYGKISLPPGFNPSTIQPVGRCYTNCAVMKLSVVIIEAWHSLINYINILLSRLENRVPKKNEVIGVEEIA